MFKSIKAILLCVCIVAGTITFAGYANAATQSNNKAKAINYVSGVPSKTGCLVCHGDAKIIKTKTKSKTKKNLYIGKNMVFTSSHKDLACIECHTDFSKFTATKDHKADIPNYKVTARLSCQKCHDHAKQLQQYNQSIHGKTAKAIGEKRGADCVDCHGTHGIMSVKKGTASGEQFRMSSAEICGKCHKSYVESYNDYYHGKGYNQMATDAPVCWDCHGSHNIQPKGSPYSTLSDANISVTCNKCHVDVRMEFAKEYGKLIHGSSKLRSDNIAISIANKIMTWVSVNILDRVRGVGSFIGTLGF
jgi:hypothetical protein